MTAEADTTKPPRRMLRPRKAVLYARVAELERENRELRAAMTPVVFVGPDGVPVAASIEEAQAMGLPPGTVIRIAEPARRPMWQRWVDYWRTRWFGE